MDDLTSDDEWTMEEIKASSSLDDSYEDILVEVRENEDASKGGVTYGWFGGSSNFTNF